uniref:Uncharacterized protein n=1 Tax=Oryza rufipogon TaxID=4529 RepID=A0A0E0PPP3_ORYRU
MRSGMPKNYQVTMVFYNVKWQMSKNFSVSRALQSYQGYFSMRKQSANSVGSKHRLKMRMLI